MAFVFKLKIKYFFSTNISIISLYNMNKCNITYIFKRINFYRRVKKKMFILFKRIYKKHIKQISILYKKFKF